MRIYCVADIHGKGEKLAVIRKNIHRFNPDILVVAGDVTNYIRWTATLAELNEMAAPVLAVRGNSDLPIPAFSSGRHSNISFLHLSKKVIKGVLFVGIGGAIPVPFGTRICLGEKRAFKRLDSALEKNCILIAHSPPYGILDKVGGRFHAGCRSLGRTVKEGRCKILICGHIHEQAGMATVGGTVIVNCAMGKKKAGAIIDYDGERQPEINWAAA